MKLFKFKGQNTSAEAVVISETLEEAIVALSSKVGDDVEVYLANEAEVSKIKRTTILIKMSRASP